MTSRNLGALLFAAVTSGVIGAADSSASPSAENIDVQGHRGTRGHRPEDTLPSFAEAMCIGVTTVELDVGVTKDGVVVSRHGRGLHPHITRKPDGQFVGNERILIHSLTLAELRRYDVGRARPASRYVKTYTDQVPIDGTRIPTLEEAIALVDPARTGVRLSVETKISPEWPGDTLPPDALTDAVLAVLRKTGVVKYTTLQSFDWRTLAHAKAKAPEIPRIHLSQNWGGSGAVELGQPGGSPWFAGHDVDDFDGSLPKLIASLDGAGWSPLKDDLDPESVREARALGLRVIPWTVNDPDDMNRLIDWGVTGMITDYPERLNAVLRARGLAVPPPVAVSGAKGRSLQCPPDYAAASSRRPD